MRISMLFAALCVAALTLPGSSKAWRPKAHDLIANQAACRIIATNCVPAGKGRPPGPEIDDGTVEIDGKSYPLRPEVRQAIADYPDYFRGGSLGPDAFPDVPQGEAFIHPDSKTKNGIVGCRHPAGAPPGEVEPSCPSRPRRGRNSVTWQWLDHVYRSGWSAYNRCQVPSCKPEAEQVLAFTYGFLVHAAGDVFGHTLVNGCVGIFSCPAGYRFAEGEWPFYEDMLRDTRLLPIAVRHVIIEGYVDKHTPATETAINVPLGFLYSTFMDNSRAATLNRGPIIEAFFALRDLLKRERQRVLDDLNHQDKVCLVSVGGHCKKRAADPTDAPANPIEAELLRAEKRYLNAWISNLERGLKAYPKLSLDVARVLFVPGATDDFDHAQSKVLEVLRRYGLDYGLAMIGFPKALGPTIERIYEKIEEVREFIDSLIPEWIKKQLKWLTHDAAELLENFQEWLADEIASIIKKITGVDIRVKEFIEHPERHINNTAYPISFPSFAPGQPNTGQQLDALMAITNGVAKPTVPFDLGRSGDAPQFAAMHNSIVLAKLALLDAKGLNAVLADHGVAAHYRDTVRGPSVVLPANIMLGWIRCIDCDHQWRAKSPVRDQRSYGEGNLFLWKDCQARKKVFRVIFRDWENGPMNFPDLGDVC
jgi:hypothetical protein